jgi:type I restriction-modification system DNA methylase subunit
MDAAEYKHVVLGLIFLKYISDAFDDIVPMFIDEIGTDWENDAAGVKDICVSERVFYVPPSARWKYLQGRAKLPTIGKDLLESVRNNTTIDWTIKENVQATLRRNIRRILRKYGYPPDLQEKAVQTVIDQAKLLAEDLVNKK